MDEDEVIETGTEQEGAAGAQDAVFDAFTAALFGEEEPETTQAQPEVGETQSGTQPPAETAGDGTAPPEGQAEGGENHEETQTEERQAETLPLNYANNAFQLDAAAVQSLAGALGGTQQDVLQLLMRGMDYDHKAVREIGILNDFAQEAGVSLPEYVERLENTRDQNMVIAEMERIAAEMPEGTPEEALRRIAEQNLAGQFAERKAQQQQQAQLAADREKQARADAWMPLFAEHPELLAEGGAPQELFEIMGKYGCTPGEAYYRMQAQQVPQLAEQLAEAQRALAAEQQKNKNKETAAGSQSTAGDDGSDAFLNALFS